MNEDQNNDGLRERIAKAETPGEVKTLLELGSTYTQASDRSRRAWRNTAQRRLAELAKLEAQPVDDEPDWTQHYGRPLAVGGVR